MFDKTLIKIQNYVEKIVPLEDQNPTIEGQWERDDLIRSIHKLKKGIISQNQCMTFLTRSILDQIYSMLHYKDTRSMFLVCYTWRQRLICTNKSNINLRDWEQYYHTCDQRFPVIQYSQSYTLQQKSENVVMLNCRIMDLENKSFVFYFHRNIETKEIVSFYIHHNIERKSMTFWKCHRNGLIEGQNLINTKTYHCIKFPGTITSNGKWIAVANRLKFTIFQMEEKLKPIELSYDGDLDFPCIYLTTASRFFYICTSKKILIYDYSLIERTCSLKDSISISSKKVKCIQETKHLLLVLTESSLLTYFLKNNKYVGGINLNKYHIDFMVIQTFMNDKNDTIYMNNANSSFKLPLDELNSLLVRQCQDAKLLKEKKEIVDLIQDKYCNQIPFLDNKSKKLSTIMVWLSDFSQKLQDKNIEFSKRRRTLSSLNFPLPIFSAIIDFIYYPCNIPCYSRVCKTWNHLLKKKLLSFPIWTTRTRFHPFPSKFNLPELIRDKTRYLLIHNRKIFSFFSDFVWYSSVEVTNPQIILGGQSLPRYEPWKHIVGVMFDDYIWTFISGFCKFHKYNSTKDYVKIYIGDISRYWQNNNRIIFHLIGENKIICLDVQQTSSNDDITWIKTANNT